MFLKLDRMKIRMINQVEDDFEARPVSTVSSIFPSMRGDGDLCDADVIGEPMRREPDPLLLQLFRTVDRAFCLKPQRAGPAPRQTRSSPPAPGGGTWL